MATIDGTRAFGLNHEIGIIKFGKRADISLIELEQMHLTPRPNVVLAIAYAATAGDVKTVLVDDQVVV